MQRTHATHRPSRPLNRSAAQPLSRSAAQPLSHSTAQPVPLPFLSLPPQIERAVNEWNFKYLKLDFLHSPIVAHNTVRHDPTLTRAEIFARFMASIRKAAGPDVFILGCGLPVGPGLGWVDAARVSADAGESWGPVLNDKWNIPGTYR